MEKRYLTDDVFIIEDFMSHHECKHYIELTEQVGYDDATINTGMAHVVDKSIRNNERVIVDDIDMATSIWKKAKDFIPEKLYEWHAIGVNERFRFYRYDKYQMFRWHRDGAYKRSNFEESKLTFMVYLNDDFEGGFTDFREFKVWPKAGMALCFNHKLLHEGTTVTHGRKYVLRTDIMYRYDG